MELPCRQRLLFIPKSCVIRLWAGSGMFSEPKNRVLIVEDTVIMADVLKRSLIRAGLNPTVARNGVEACDLVQKQKFDVVVSDFQMPRMNGDEFVRNLRMTPLNCDVPVILVSGKGLELDTEQLRIDLRIRCFLFKPFSPSELITVVTGCLAEQEKAVDCVAAPAVTQTALPL
jgi:two-component system chemotaxis response regulator CheY